MRTLLIAVLLLASCKNRMSGYSLRIEKHTIKSVYRDRPANVTEEFNPPYRAILENGDTFPFRVNSKIGDTIIYKIYELNG